MRTSPLPEHARIKPVSQRQNVHACALLAARLRHAAQTKALFWVPIVFAGFFPVVQSDSRVWSSRQTPPAADWPTFSWCEQLWPINVRQSTPRVLAWRRERRGRLRRAGGGRDVRRWPRLLALPTPRRLNTGGIGTSRQVSPAPRSRKDGVRQMSRPPGGVLQPAAIPHGRPAEFHTQDGPGKPSIPAPSQSCGRCVHPRSLEGGL